MPGQSLSRVCIVHVPSGICLYDRITPYDEVLWTTGEVDKYSSEVAFMVSGTKREREQRQELVNLIQLMFALSRDLDEGDVCKACFQTPAANRGNAFAVKFTPHFGTLPRPKKTVNANLSSMVFGQSNMEMVIQSQTVRYTHTNGSKETKLICAVFYGPNVPFGSAKVLSTELLAEFLKTFTKQVSRLLSKYDLNSLLSDPNGGGANNNNSNDPLAPAPLAPTKSNDTTYGQDDGSYEDIFGGSSNKNGKLGAGTGKNSGAAAGASAAEAAGVTELDQESIMSQFKQKFDLVAMRLIQKYIDTRELRRKDRENENEKNAQEQSIEHINGAHGGYNSTDDEDEMKQRHSGHSAHSGHDRDHRDHRDQRHGRREQGQQRRGNQGNHSSSNRGGRGHQNGRLGIGANRVVRGSGDANGLGGIPAGSMGGDSAVESGMESPFGNEDSKSQSESLSNENLFDNSKNYSETDEKNSETGGGSSYYGMSGGGAAGVATGVGGHQGRYSANKYGRYADY